MAPTSCAERTHAPAATPRGMRGELPTNAQPDWLYDALRATIHGERSRAKVIAEAIACGTNHVHDLADPGRRVPLKAFEIPGLVIGSDCYDVLDALEAKVGRVAFALPSLPAHHDEMQQELSRSVVAFGEFLKENGSALSDGVLEAHEVQPLLRALDQMIAGLCEYRGLVIDKAKQDGALEGVA